MFSQAARGSDDQTDHAICQDNATPPIEAFNRNNCPVPGALMPMTTEHHAPVNVIAQKRARRSGGPRCCWLVSGA